MSNVERNFINTVRILTAAGTVAAGSSVARADSISTPDNQTLPPINYRATTPEGEGWVYRETNGSGSNPDTNKDHRGFAVMGQMWRVIVSEGGVDKWGFPVTQEFQDELNRTVQCLQKGCFQLTRQNGQVVNIEWDNTNDKLELKGIYPALTAHPLKWNTDPAAWGHNRNGGLPGTIEENRIKTIFTLNPEIHAPNITQAELDSIKAKYLEDLKWFEMYGLVNGIEDFGDVLAVRAQRADFQLWRIDVPWARKGQVVIANGGDLAKLYLVEGNAVQAADFTGQGGGEIRPNPVTERELYIQEKSWVVDQAETTDGKIALVSRSMNNSNYSVNLSPDHKQTLSNLINKTNTFVELVVSSNKSDIPQNITLETTRVRTTPLGQEPNWMNMGESGAEFTNGKLIFYFIPAQDIFRNQTAYNNSIITLTSQIFRAAISKGNINADVLSGNAEYTNTINSMVLSVNRL